MSAFSEVNIEDLLLRYNSLIEKYVHLAQELAPKLEKFGKYRQELQEITVEFVSRGVSIEDPQNLTEIMKEEIEKRQQNASLITEKK